MGDPNWNNGRYYGKSFPRMGMQHARCAQSAVSTASVTPPIPVERWAPSRTAVDLSGPSDLATNVQNPAFLQISALTLR